MLSHTSKYALKSLHYLALKSSEKNKLNANELATITNVPKPYLSKLFKKLASLDVVSSLKGPNGGFYLTEGQKDQSVLEVIKSLEGVDYFHDCVLDFEACNAENPCPLHFLINREKEALRDALKKIKISDLSSDLTYLK